MKLLTCPMNGPRNIEEFESFGPLKSEPDPAATTDDEWARQLFRVDNRPRVIVEWWRHAPSNYFFLAERDIVTNTILRTFDPSGLGATE
jgi:sarcosine oxidase subunit delta